MPPQSDIADSKRWLMRTYSALEDACSDMHYTVQTGKPVYLSFDPSFLFPPLGLRDRLDINRPKDWIDISSNAIFNNLDQYKPELLGYQLIMPHLTFLSIQNNYKIDIELVERISDLKTDDEIFSFFESSVLGFGRSNSQRPSSESVLSEISDFLARTTKQHIRLLRLRDYIKRDIILPEPRLISEEMLKKSAVSRDSFDALRKEIQNYKLRSTITRDVSANRSPPDNPNERWSANDAFVQGVETGLVLLNRNLTDNFSDGRYLFMGWPSARNYYSSPTKYHRSVTSLFMRLVSLIETSSTDNLIPSSNAYLLDALEQVRFFLNKVRLNEKNNENLSQITATGIIYVRDNYVKHLLGELKLSEEDERQRLAKGFSGNRREVRDALAYAQKQVQETKRTLSDIAAEFRAEEAASGWDVMEQNNPVRKLLDGIKPSP